MQRQYNNMCVSFNRADGDYSVLKRDYDKLYDAYYSYEKKILKVLEGNENVFWSEDSSAYVVKNEKGFLFSFYKKPRIHLQSYCLFIETNSSDRDPLYKYRYVSSVDSLRPHQYIICKIKGDEQSFMIARGRYEPYDVQIKINIGTR